MNHLQLSWGHNGPELSNVPQLVETGGNQKWEAAVIHRPSLYILLGTKRKMRE